MEQSSLQKQPVTLLDKTFPAFYENWKFSNVRGVRLSQQKLSTLLSSDMCHSAVW